MVASILSIVVLQGYWIYSAWEDKEEEFSLAVQQSLQLAADEIQERELSDYIQAYENLIDSLDSPDNASFANVFLFLDEDKPNNLLSYYAYGILEEDYKITPYLDPKLGDTIEEVIDLATIAACSEAVGVLQVLKDSTTDYCRQRKQFGQPIGRFQATGFKLADIAIELRAADLLVKDAVKRAYNSQMSDADAAMVKVFCSEMLNKAADNTVQLFGGMGLMEELPIQRLWRDSRLERIWDGTSEIQRHIITRSILRPLGA